jgi:hypothetical protein
MHDPVRNPYIPASDVGNDHQIGREGSLLQHVRTGQVITFAMIMGLIMMVGILLTLSIDGDKGQADDKNSILILLGIGAGFLAIITSLVLSRWQHRAALMALRANRAADDAIPSDSQTVTSSVARFLGSSASATLVGQAVLEGAAVINAVLMVIDGNLLHLAVVAVMIVGMALQTPTIAKRRAAIESAFE